MLALFHKLERKKKKYCGGCCYKARGTDNQPLNTAVCKQHGCIVLINIQQHSTGCRYQ